MTDFFELILSLSAAIGKPGASSGERWKSGSPGHVRARCSGQNLSLADRGGRFHINDDRIVDIDQTVGGVSEESLPAKSSGPASCRIGRRDELGRDLGRPAESSVLEHSQILLNGSACGFRRQPFLALDALLPRLASTAKPSPPTRPSSMHAAGPSQRRAAGDRSRGTGHAGSSRRWNDRGHRRRARAGRTTCTLN